MQDMEKMKAKNETEIFVILYHRYFQHSGLPPGEYYTLNY